MKVKVIKSFYDRANSLSLRKQGDAFEADKQRASELISLGFVEKVASKADTKTEKAN